MPLKFTWDPSKAADNLAKHGVGFEEAATVFGDPLSLTIEDPDHPGTEQRFIIVGASFSGQLLLVVHTDDENSIRIVSARRATKRERRDYEQR